MPEPFLQSSTRDELLDRIRHALMYARESERMLLDALRLVLDGEADEDV